MKQASIIIIFGASGSGKTTLVEQFKNSGEEYSIHIKHTDRPARQYDDVEIKSVKNFDPKNYDYVYQTYGFTTQVLRSTRSCRKIRLNIAAKIGADAIITRTLATDVIINAATKVIPCNA